MNLRDFHLQPTRDHVIPQSKGGKITTICCLKCNNIKGDMLPEQWTAYMAANPGYWLLTRAERRALMRTSREAKRTEKWGPRKIAMDQILGRPSRQGSPKPAPVVVPVEYIYPKAPVIPMADSQYILTHGKKAFRSMERLRTLTPELIQYTIEQDARLRC